MCHGVHEASPDTRDHQQLSSEKRTVSKPTALDMFSNKNNYISYLRRFHSLFFSTTMEVALSKSSSASGLLLLNLLTAEAVRHEAPKTPPSAKWSSTTAQGVDKLLRSGVVFPTNGGEMESSWNHHPR